MKGQENGTKPVWWEADREERKSDEMTIKVTLNMSSLLMDFGYSDIAVLEAVQQPWTVGSRTGNISLTLANTGNITGSFGAVPLGCCLAMSFCSPSSMPQDSGITLTSNSTSQVPIAPGANSTFWFTVGAPSLIHQLSCSLSKHTVAELTLSHLHAAHTSASEVNSSAGVSGVCNFNVTLDGVVTPPLTSVFIVSIPSSPPPPPPSPPRPPPPPSPPPRPPPPIPHIAPTLTFEMIFQGILPGDVDATFLQRYRAAIAATAQVPASQVTILSYGANRRRLLAGTGIQTQVVFNASISTTAADQFSSMLSTPESVLASDPTLVEIAGPVTVSSVGNPTLVTLSPPPPPPQSPPPPVLPPPPPPLASPPPLLLPPGVTIAPSPPPRPPSPPPPQQSPPPPPGGGSNSPSPSALSPPSSTSGSTPPPPDDGVRSAYRCAVKAICRKRGRELSHDTKC
eukprot:jgi/Botrbrau1/5078/Bobra.37_1s0042.1